MTLVKSKSNKSNHPPQQWLVLEPVNCPFVAERLNQLQAINCLEPSNYLALREASRIRQPFIASA